MKIEKYKGNTPEIKQTGLNEYNQDLKTKTEFKYPLDKEWYYKHSQTLRNLRNLRNLKLNHKEIDVITLAKLLDIHIRDLGFLLKKVLGDLNKIAPIVDKDVKITGKVDFLIDVNIFVYNLIEDKKQQIANSEPFVNVEEFELKFNGRNTSEVW